MQAAPASSSRAALPLLAICCLGLILFVIAAAIVLALIPVYLPRKNISSAVNSDGSNGPFYVQYTAPGNGANAISGNIQNNAAVASALNLPSNVQMTTGQTAPSGVNRRKRSFFSSRSKRDITINVIIGFIFTEVVCDAPCLIRRRQFKNSIQQKKSISNVPLTIDGGPLGVVSTTVSLTLVGFMTSKPSIFRGPPSSVIFTSTTSGDFTNSAIWDQQQIPNGPCTIVIAAGTTVTLSLSGLSIGAKLIYVYGTLVLGGGNSAFRFVNSIAIKVYNGGIVTDATSSKLIVVAPNSILFALPGGTLGAKGTVIQAYSSTGTGNSITISNPSGPLTCAALPSGAVLTANKITFYVVSSGNIIAGTTYIAGLGPTLTDCQVASCGLVVLPGFTLSTAIVQSVFKLNFSEIDIDPGATMQLGTPGATAGLKFVDIVNIECAGVLQFVASGGNILVPIGSSFSILAGGSFSSAIATSLQVYDTSTGNLGVAQYLGTSITTVFGFVAASLTAFVNISAFLGNSGVGVSIPAVTAPTTTVVPVSAPVG